MSDELARARNRAMRLYPRAPNFRATYVRGVQAALAGRASSACPYKRDPKKTWRAAWRAAWLRGYQSVPPRR